MAMAKEKSARGQPKSSAIGSWKIPKSRADAEADQQDHAARQQNRRERGVRVAGHGRAFNGSVGVIGPPSRAATPFGAGQQCSL
jgi:hypothetical protein